MRCLLLLALVATPAYAEGKSLDKTGIHWELPFEKALAKAKADNRLLLIKPIAFGTSADGGW